MPTPILIDQLVTTGAQLNSAISAANSRVDTTVPFVIGIQGHLTSTGVTPITTSNVTITSAGGLAGAVLEFSASNLAAFFKITGPYIEENLTQIENVTIENIKLISNTSAPSNGSSARAAIEVDYAQYVQVRNIEAFGVGCFARVGAAAGCKHVLIENVRGEFNPTLNPQVIIINKCVQGRFFDVNLVGPKISSSGCGVYIGDYIEEGSLSGDNIDTLFFEKVVIPCKGGMNYGIHMDSTKDNITNVWFNECIFDLTTSAAVRIAGGAGSRPYSSISITNCHFATMTGIGVSMTFDPTSAASRGFLFSGNMISVTVSGGYVPESGVSTGTAWAIRIQAYNLLHALQIANNTFTDDFFPDDFFPATPPLPPAPLRLGFIRTDTGNFSCVGNGVCRRSVAGRVSTQTRYLVSIEADIDDFYVAGNALDGLTQGVVNHYSYGANSLNRQVNANPGVGLGQTLIGHYTVPATGTVTVKGRLPVSVNGTVYYLDLQN